MDQRRSDSRRQRALPLAASGTDRKMPVLSEGTVIAGGKNAFAPSRLIDRLVQGLGLAPICGAIIRFLCVGLVGLAVDSGIFSLLFHNGAGAPAARAVSLPAATLVTWWINSAVTFERSGRAPIAELTRYCCVALFVQGFNYLAFLAMFFATGSTYPMACLAASAAMTAALSFCGHFAFTFARRAEVRSISARGIRNEA